MESPSTPYRIATRSGIVIATDLPRSSPAIQLQEGIVSKGDKLPRDLDPGESSIVAYPLVEGSLVCRVTRTDGHIDDGMYEPIEFVEPDPAPNKKPKVAAMLETATKEAIEGTKVRRGRGKRVVS